MIDRTLIAFPFHYLITFLFFFNVSKVSFKKKKQKTDGLTHKVKLVAC